MAAALPTMAEQGVALADTSRVYDLDEVVVVSQNKEFMKLRQQPVSSTVLTGTELFSLGSRDLRDIANFVPSFVMPDYGARFTSSIYVRGIGSRVNSPSMGIYIDDVPLVNKSMFNSHVYELDRVDVLRGPQGTLYGRNTMGGLIRVYTKNPMNYQGTDLMVGAATYNNYRARVTHYHRPADNFAFSAGVSYEHQGGFFRNHAQDKHHVDRGDDIAAHWRGIYRPSERVNIDLSARYQWTRQGAYPYAEKEGPDAGHVAYNRKGSYQRHNLNVGLKAEHNFDRVVMSSITGFQFLKDDMNMDQDYSREDIFALQQKQNSKVLSEEIALKSKNSGRLSLSTTAPCRWAAPSARLP